MKRSEILFIFKAFLIWRLGLFAILYLATQFLLLQPHFLGGGMQNYLANPFLWAWGNFDGEHYLAISQFGYQPLTYFFFPVYPMLVRLMGGGQFAALLISNLSFLAALIGFYKLSRLDFNEKISRLAIILLLIFPTSFYFGSTYTESLFLALIVWSFYLLRRSNFLLSSVLTAVSGATRIVGMVVAAAHLPEYVKKKRWEVVILPLGILAYMFYLYQTTGNPLDFLNTIGIFGEQRSSNVILLPQVFYRYFFKVLPNLDYSVFVSFYPAILETAVAMLFTFLSIYSFFKLKLDQSLYLVFGMILFALPGSFSSLPRYVLVLFPAFLLSSILLQKTHALMRAVVFVILLAGLVISTALFVRGYWIA